MFKLPQLPRLSHLLLGLILLASPALAQKHERWTAEELILVTAFDGDPSATQLDANCMASCFEKRCRPKARETPDRATCLDHSANSCRKGCFKFLYNNDDSEL